MSRNRSCRIAWLALLAVAALRQGAAIGQEHVPDGVLPQRLSDTGLYVPGSLDVQPGILAYSPQYPLWSDGATKRRWLYLPPGTAIDGTDFDAWQFPAGTRIWKEFSQGRPVETRYMERLVDGSWRYATYVWDADGRDAALAPERGIAGSRAAGRYPIPSKDDCLACHEGAAVPVLGISALQLSPDRDPLAPHADTPRPGDIDLPELLRRGLLQNVAPELRDAAPRLNASSPAARAALGYLHGNCGHCHNARGPLADIGMVLAQESAAGWQADTLLATTVGQRSDSGADGPGTRVVAGNAARSELVARMRSRNPYRQMPPLGTEEADGTALALIEHWIEQLPTWETDNL